MHFTCKNTPVIPDRNGLMKGPEKVSKSFHCQSKADCGNCTFNEVTAHGVSFQKVKFVENSTCRFLAWPVAIQRNDNTMQVRRADQALYHHELTVSSLGSVCQSCTAPCCKSSRSFTSIQMFHTHAPLARGFLRLRQVR